MKFHREKNEQPNDVTFSDIYFNKYDKYESFLLTGWIHSHRQTDTHSHIHIRRHMRSAWTYLAHIIRSSNKWNSSRHANEFWNFLSSLLLQTLRHISKIFSMDTVNVHRFWEFLFVLDQAIGQESIPNRKSFQIRNLSLYGVSICIRCWQQSTQPHSSIFNILDRLKIAVG